MSQQIQHRNSALINKAYRKLILPDISSRMLNMLVLLADSLIAARYIGTTAVSAIALVAPLTLFDSCLHDLLCSGTTPLLIKYKSRGQLSQADRAFAAILVNTFFWYAVIYGISLPLSGNIFRLFSQDDILVSDAVQYFIPMALFQPFCELGLCFERGFKTDGRSGFFGVRIIITNILNVVFSIAAVELFHGGILGISIASFSSGLLGYCWSFSHFFSKECTIRPDFSVFRSFSEVKNYLGEEMKIGCVYALDDGLFAVASAMLNKAIIITGGTPALTAVGICSAMNNVFYSVDGSIQGASYNLCNMFYSDRDYKGAAMSLRTSVILEACFGASAWAILNGFSRQIGLMYKVDSPEVMLSLRLYLRFFTLASIFDCFTNLFSSYMLATDKTKAAGHFSVAHNVMFFISALIGMTGIQLSSLLCIYMIASALVAAGEAVLLIASGSVFGMKNEAEVRTYSYTLNSEVCSEISRSVVKALSSRQVFSPAAQRAALLVEECSRLILYVNREHKNELSVDFRISVDENECVITIIDTGILFDPVNRLIDSDLPQEFAASRRILTGFSPSSTYARVLNLNVSHLVIPLNRPCLSQNN